MSDKSSKMISEDDAGKLFDLLASDKSDAALIANLTMSNHSEEYNSKSLMERAARLTSVYIEDLAAAKAKFKDHQNKS